MEYKKLIYDMVAFDVLAHGRPFPDDPYRYLLRKGIAEMTKAIDMLSREQKNSLHPRKLGGPWRIYSGYQWPLVDHPIRAVWWYVAVDDDGGWVALQNVVEAVILEGRHPRHVWYVYQKWCQIGQHIYETLKSWGWLNG